MYNFPHSAHPALMYSIVTTLLLISTALLSFAVWHYAYEQATQEQDNSALSTDASEGYLEGDSGDEFPSSDRPELTDEDRVRIMNENFPNNEMRNSDSGTSLTDEERRELMYRNTGSEEISTDDSSRELTDEDRARIMNAN